MDSNERGLELIFDAILMQVPVTMTGYRGGPHPSQVAAAAYEAIVIEENNRRQRHSQKHFDWQLEQAPNTYFRDLFANALERQR